MTGPPAGTSRIPSLDGLRAVSIAAVLVGHLSGTRGTSYWLRVTETRHFDLAYFGVAVFFIISGYLITGLLLAELDDTGDIHLSRFYLRRALRILPASGMYIAVIGMLALAGVLTIPARDFWHALTYTMNYTRHPSWQLGHLWSLSLEEQFYLLWPVTLALAGRRRAMWGARRRLHRSRVPDHRMELGSIARQHLRDDSRRAGDGMPVRALAAGAPASPLVSPLRGNTVARAGAPRRERDDELRTTVARAGVPGDVRAPRRARRRRALRGAARRRHRRAAQQPSTRLHRHAELLALPVAGAVHQSPQ